MRLAILRSDDAHHVYLSALLQSRFEVVGELVEPAAAQRQRLLTRRRFKDYTYARYHHARRRALGLDAYRRGYFADPEPVAPERRATSIQVDWINSSAALEQLRRWHADVAVVICTSILKPATIEAAGAMVINVHGGHLPEYRGNHCFFFALYEGRFEKIGASIHFVDRGVDTGDIIEVVHPAIHPTDDAERLYCRADMLAIRRLVVHLEAAERGEPLPRRRQGEGRTFRTRDRTPRHDLLLWARRRTGRLEVPERPGERLRVDRPMALL